MKKIMALMLLTLICFNSFANEAAAYEKPGSSEANASSANTSMQNDLNSISSEINELAGRIEAAKPAGTREEQQKQFFSLSLEIDQLDNKIDSLENRVNADYTAGTLTWEEYRTIVQTLDTLDDMLDRADDLLERIFGMDD